MTPYIYFFKFIFMKFSLQYLDWCCNHNRTKGHLNVLIRDKKFPHNDPRLPSLPFRSPTR